MLQQYLTKRNILIAVGVVGSLILIGILYEVLHFHVRSTTPSLNRVATATSEITYKLSQPIRSVGKVTFNSADITESIQIDGNELTLPIDELEKDRTYTVTISNLQSDWLNNQIITIDSEFTPEYVDFNDLSEDQQKAQVDNSHSGQVDDDFISDNNFPIFNRRWQLEATVVNTDRTVILTVSFFEEVPDYDNGGAVSQVSNETAEQYRNEVLKEIKDRGGNPEDYTIVYKTNRYLNEKYNTIERYHD